MIPVIDVAPYLAGRPRAFAAAATELGRALEDVGFFVVVGHGIPQGLIDDTFAQARRFHAQPMDAKLALRMNEHNNGYMMLGRYAVWTSDVNANDKPDLNEAFFVKRERGPDDPLVRAGRRFAGPNRWPADLPGFRDAVLAYTDAVDALGRKLLPLCATALDLPSGAFDGAFAESQFSFRLTHYPPVAAEANQYGIAPHTDANFMTFLAQSEVPGLQVRMPDATWLDVPYVPGSFAVNSGDMMQRWTNHRFKSTPHRALPPVGRPRYAIPYFMGPHLDTEIACLPTCQGPGNPPRHTPITYAAYLDWWYDANYNAARASATWSTPMDVRDLFLDQHAAMHSAAVGGNKMSASERAFTGLTDEQMRVRPREDLNSLAWLMFHISRAEDIFVNTILGARTQLFDDESWAKRLAIARRDFGIGMTSAEVTELTRQIELGALREYRDAVGRRTRDVVGGFKSQDWDGTVAADAVQRAAGEGAFGVRTEQIVKAFPGRPRSAMLSGIALFHSAGHIGEAATVRTAGGFGTGV